MSGAGLSAIRWPWVASFALLILTAAGVAGYLAAPTTLVAGNVHDFFIPLNAAYVVSQEGLGHPGLSSPFGVIYFVLSANSAALIGQFPQWLGLDKVQMISALQWMAVVTALFLAYRHFQEKDRRFPLWLLAVLLLLCAQAKNFDSLVPLPNWYGTYNLHMWAVLVLQGANHYAWRGKGPAGRAVAWLGMLEAIVLLLQFNYKISFFVAGCGMSLLPLWYLRGHRDRIVYYGALVATAGLVTAALAALGVPYGRYLRDLAVVARAKTVAGPTLVLQGLFAVAFIVTCCWVDGGGPAQPRIAARLGRWAFHGVAAAAIAAGALGDYFTPVWPYLLLALWAASAAPAGSRGWAERRPVAVVAALLVGLLAFSAIASLLVLASDAVMARQKRAVGSEFVTYDPRAIGFRVFAPVSGLDEVVATGLLARPADAAQRLFELSYRGVGRERARLGGMLSAMAGADYIADLNATADWLKAEQGALRGQLVIGHVGFTNAWPLLTGNRLPPGSPHWAHLGTTMTPASLGSYLDTLAGADVVVVPLLSVSGPDQTVFNCAFHQWNAAHGHPFVAQHLAGRNLIYLRKDGRLPATGPVPVREDPADIKQHCDQVLGDALAGIE